MFCYIVSVIKAESRLKSMHSLDHHTVKTVLKKRNNNRIFHFGLFEGKTGWEIIV